MTAVAVRLAPFPPLTGAEPCRRSDVDPELWFSASALDQAEAADHCRSCPIRSQCLAYALDHPTETSDGVWAATTPKLRRALRRQFTDTATDSEETS
ncbi:WhiB family transcriptional regulator [Streptomyces sp. H10-C2]|uniref:WhiB family transcriptional regulator n=1 Tax=unclassified Streptomyces TaxID=2593676 RepID=UPI0024B9D30E|nr:MULTISPECIES: WhiB family transcriptional regulator [unclassified Streptomyces]MDJ0346384.1 WhiB family transcriptional regulator [Streptomyces sp. PH10-H1]MDJ0374926.1 WhiB family transcriptional regulator [Streptomyces sp. H10-C2]